MYISWYRNRPPVARASQSDPGQDPSSHSSLTKRPQHNSIYQAVDQRCCYRLQKNGKWRDRQEREGTKYSITIRRKRWGRPEKNRSCRIALGWGRKWVVAIERYDIQRGLNQIIMIKRQKGSPRGFDWSMREWRSVSHRVGMIFEVDGPGWIWIRNRY